MSNKFATARNGGLMSAADKLKLDMIDPSGMYPMIPCDPTPTIVSSNIPSITAGSRAVVDIALGYLRNPYRVLCIFFPDAANALNMRFPGVGLTPLPLHEGVIGSDVTPLTPMFNTAACTAAMLSFTQDYRTAMRAVLAINEKTGNGTALWSAADGYALSYTEFGLGVLVGYYSIANTGVFGSNKKLVLESGWLTPGADLNTNTLSLAFRNVDATNYTEELAFKISVFN